MLLNIVAALELEDMAVLAHAHPVSACGEQHGTQTGRRAELDEDVSVACNTSLGLRPRSALARREIAATVAACPCLA
jgi:hypothetical protein